MGESQEEIGEQSSNSTVTHAIQTKKTCQTVMLRSKPAIRVSTKEVTCLKTVHFRKNIHRSDLVRENPKTDVKTGSVISEKQNGKKLKDSDSGKDKKRKWKRVPELTSFYLPPISSQEDEQLTERSDDFNVFDVDEYFGFADFPCVKQTFTDLCDKFEGKGGDKTLRATKKNKVRKAHKQVKDKYCTSLQNNNGKELFVHHRVYKAMKTLPRKENYLPTKRVTFADEASAQNGQDTKNRKANSEDVWEKAPKESKVENHRFALNKSNVPSDIRSLGIADILLSLQERELTPEDYELLLQLDERVAPKTISTSKLNRLKTDTATEAHLGLVCAVCLEHYTSGQRRKFLPCSHVFHEACIDMWLSNSSQCCPLDGLPIS
ncbi:uncharacterized protein LOC106175774 [Lingula anatina]|uniref:Uncharacterized protein LOC106175774 n=1 Tax=Lingula anatina TaxID=7574 RepID=A0A1S3JSP1_LINAN|nr:uncharacterized protein LOC106175774 [Lingula anatina]|eukprot:XP_013413368.1 uncharacterized protein LOC106175774 [Lingula anatina]